MTTVDAFGVFVDGKLVKVFFDGVAAMDDAVYRGDANVRPVQVGVDVAQKDEEIDQLRVQLAGCLTAAEGVGADQPAKQGDYGWSPAYQAVLDLRKKYDELTAIPDHVDINTAAAFAYKLVGVESSNNAGPDGEPTYYTSPLIRAFLEGAIGYSNCNNSYTGFIHQRPTVKALAEFLIAVGLRLTKGLPEDV